MASLSLATRALWSLKAFKAPLSGASIVPSQRLFHTTRSAFEEAKTDGTTAANAEGEEVEEDDSEDAASVNTKLPRRRKRFNMWLQNEGTRFASPSFSGPNYVSEVPFPMNPLFKPTPPISNSAKEEIYRLHRSDSRKWTPRQLGTKYNISIKRVEAILRLKHLEKEMVADGYVAQENYTKGMEQLMGVKAERSAAITEPLTDILPQVGSPKFEAVDESLTFTPEDAAKVLKRRPLAEIKALQLEMEQKNPFKLVDSVKGVPKPQPAQMAPISRNNAESNARFRFAIVDTSAKPRTGLRRPNYGPMQQRVFKKYPTTPHITRRRTVLDDNVLEALHQTHIGPITVPSNSASSGQSGSVEDGGVSNENAYRDNYQERPMDTGMNDEQRWQDQPVYIPQTPKRESRTFTMVPGSGRRTPRRRSRSSNQHLRTTPLKALADANQARVNHLISEANKRGRVGRDKHSPMGILRVLSRIPGFNPPPQSPGDRQPIPGSANWRKLTPKALRTNYIQIPDDPPANPFLAPSRSSSHRTPHSSSNSTGRREQEVLNSAERQAYDRFRDQNPFLDVDDFNKLWEDELGVTRRGDQGGRASFGVGASSETRAFTDDGDTRDFSIAQGDFTDPFINPEDIRERSMHIGDISNASQREFVDDQGGVQRREGQDFSYGDYAYSTTLTEDASNLLSNPKTISLGLSMSQGQAGGEIGPGLPPHDQVGRLRDINEAELQRLMEQEMDFNMDDGWEDIPEDETGIHEDIGRPEMEAAAPATEGEKSAMKDVEMDMPTEVLAPATADMDAETQPLTNHDMTGEDQALPEDAGGEGSSLARGDGALGGEELIGEDRVLTEEEQNAVDLALTADVEQTELDMAMLEEEQDRANMEEEEEERKRVESALAAEEERDRAEDALGAEDEHIHTDPAMVNEDEQDRAGLMLPTEVEQDRVDRNLVDENEHDRRDPPAGTMEGADQKSGQEHEQIDYQDGYMNVNDEDHIEQQEQEEHRDRHGVHYFDDFPSELGIMSNGEVLPTSLPAPKKNIRLSAAGLPVPSLPTSLQKQLVHTFSRSRISQEAMAVILEGTTQFFEQAANDLAAYAKHAGRMTIDESDVECLMQRLRITNNKVSMESLLQRYLPRELRDKVLFPDDMQHFRRK
ncbi:hypothetical protein EDD11_003673 [Mortierella claussenii]|nr:hypothetical protein EDD11_003673 [Mortierella claussenii]